MISRLLQSAAATLIPHGTSRPSVPLESATEDAHTRGLLFPDPSLIPASSQDGLPIAFQIPTDTSQNATSYDDHGGLDFTYPDAIRVLIAQDANSQYQAPQILFDSKHSVHFGLTSQEERHELKNCEGQTSDPNLRLAEASRTLPKAELNTRRSSLLSGRRASGPSPLSRRSTKTTAKEIVAKSDNIHQGDVPSNDAKAWQTRVGSEEKEDLDDLLACVFGAAGFRLSASSKLHIVPSWAFNRCNTQVKYFDSCPSDSPDNLSQQRPRLAKPKVSSRFKGSTLDTRSAEKITANTNPAIMLTRLFAINLSDSVPLSKDAAHQTDHGQGGQEAVATGKPASKLTIPTQDVKQKKCPMYAVTIILQLNTENPCNKLHDHSLQSPIDNFESSNSGLSLPNSCQAEHDSALDLPEVSASPVLSTENNQQLSCVLAHWMTMTRCMELLESKAKSSLRQLLESVPSTPKTTVSVRASNAPGKHKGSKQSMQQSIFVPPGSLHAVDEFGRHASSIVQIVVSSLKTQKVVTGQHQWRAWREEARWVERWAGNKDQNFFFYNVLTAFLGSNAHCWLESLDPPLCGKSFAAQRQQCSGDSNRIEQRTVIVASNKMAARRLLFLLSVFLSASGNEFVSPKFTTVNAGRSGAEDSPPSSLEGHQFTRWAAHGKSKGPETDSPERNPLERTVSSSVADLDSNLKMVPPTVREHRGPGSLSARTQALAIPKQSRKLGKAPISLSLAESDRPVPHFATPLVATSPRATISKQPNYIQGSPASNALSHHFKCFERAGTSESGSTRGWSSVAPRFGGEYRDSATRISRVRCDPHDRPASRKYPSENPSKHEPNHLSQKVDKRSPVNNASMKRNDQLNHGEGSETLIPITSPNRLLLTEHTSRLSGIIKSHQIEGLPLNMSLSEDGKYVDISATPGDVRDSSFAAPFLAYRKWPLQGSHLSPLRDGRSPSRPSMPGSKRLCQDARAEAAGWLKTFQPCFALQAVAPYDRLIEDIKASMYSEISLSHSSNLENPPYVQSWVEICSTLVADADTFEIKQMKLFRRRKAGSWRPDVSEIGMSDSLAAYEEKFVATPVTGMDPILVDAVERLLAHSGASTQIHSRSHSPSPMRQHARQTVDVDNSRSPSATRQERGIQGYGFTTRPSKEDAMTADCQRTVIQALREVVRSVVEESSQPMAMEARPHSGSGGELDNKLREGVRKWLAKVDDGG